MHKDWFEDDNEIRLLHRGKRRLLDIVFGRTMVITLLLVLQIAIMVLGAHYLGRYYPALTIVLRVMSVAVIIYLVNKSGSATTKITWIILVMALPAFGVLLYLFVQLDIGHRYANRRVQESILSTVQYVPRQTELMARLRTELPEVHNLAEYTLRSGDYPVYENTAVTYYPMGQDKIGALIEALQSAEHFIFLEYFIIEEGDVWGRILKILEERVRAGVEVRVLYDGTCTFYRLPYGYPKRMEALGIRCKMFAPLRPLVSTYYNNRDHRKIMVIDGQIAFTGGVNLADEYINKIVRFGYWKDSGVRLDGPGAASLANIFLTFWKAKYPDEDLDAGCDLPAAVPVETDCLVQPFADTPVDREAVAKNVYLELINQAQKRLYICTPYLILDNDLLSCLRLAAKRGVDVRIYTPGVPDKPTIYQLTRSYFPHLLRAGVKIYSYTPGFLHAKTWLVDDRIAAVGTVNLDYRSLYLHFENACWFCGCSAVADVRRDFDALFPVCREVTQEYADTRSLAVRGWDCVLRLFSPLM